MLFNLLTIIKLKIYLKNHIIPSSKNFSSIFFIFFLLNDKNVAIKILKSAI